MITVRSTGKLHNLNSRLEKTLEFVRLGELDRFGRMGVAALREATPKESGETAESWYYKIERTEEGTSIIWCNSHVEKNQNIAILLQYGHGTRNGGYVQGVDYINPAMRPVFDKIAKEAWEVIRKR